MAEEAEAKTAERVRVLITLPRDLQRQLRRRAFEDERPEYEIVEEALRAWFAAHGEQGGRSPS